MGCLIQIRRQNESGSGYRGHIKSGFRALRHILFVYLLFTFVFWLSNPLFTVFEKIRNRKFTLLTSNRGKSASLPEVLLLDNIKEGVEVEHVEADLVQGLEEEGLGQLQLVKPVIILVVPSIQFTKINYTGIVFLGL